MVVLLLRLWWQECEARDRKWRQERKPAGAISRKAHPRKIHFLQLVHRSLLVHNLPKQCCQFRTKCLNTGSCGEHFYIQAVTKEGLGCQCYP